MPNVKISSIKNNLKQKFFFLSPNISLSIATPRIDAAFLRIGQHIRTRVRVFVKKKKLKKILKKILKKY